MDIKTKRLDEIKPYERNPRKNDAAVKYVAESIRQFGFKVPIVIDRNNVIVCGHTRYAAAKLLGFDELPCVVADDLTDKQIRAFRLADNKVAEKAEWDYELLDFEIDDLSDDFDFESLGFEFDVEEEDEPRKRDGQEQFLFDASNILNLGLGQYDGDGDFDIPMLAPVKLSHKQEQLELLPFDRAMPPRKTNCGVHFFLNDYKFERVWNDPERYIDILSQYSFVLTPDFSPYSDMPRAAKIFNVYRNRWCGRYWQENGITVIPTVTWSDEDSLRYCFDGIPQHSTIAVSTMGDGAGHENLLLGWDAMISKLHPDTIILYGQDVRDKVSFDGNIICKSYTSFNFYKGKE